MPDDARNRMRLLCIGALLTGIALFYAAAPRIQHGLTATYFSDPDFNSITATRLERVAMANSNDTLISRNRPFSIRWEGYLWVDKARETTFTTPTGAVSRMLLDGELVHHARRDSLEHTLKFRQTLAPGPHALTLEFASPEPGEDFFSTGLVWNTRLGQRLIPPSFLYPAFPEDDQARGEMLRAQTRDIALWIAALATLGLIGVLVASERYCWGGREFWALIIIIAAALSLRLTYLNDLVTQLPNFDAFPLGSDHRAYEAAARDFVRGLWPPQREFYRQPGFPWILGNFHRFWGPSLRPFQILQMVGGAVTSVVIYALGKRIFGATTGWIAALLWAAFPLAIFYDAQLVTHGLEAQFVVWLMWLWINAIERPRSGSFIALGLLSGCAALIRPALLVLVPMAAISFAWTAMPRWRIGASRGLVLIGLAALPILPVTLHNYRHSGRFQLISANGPVTLYLGNNRDASGIGQYSQAFRATHERVNRGEVTYVEATLTDIRTAPRRWLGLMIRKTALYFGDLEIPNNVDFVDQGTAVSPILARTPLRFGAIVALGLTGFILSVSRPRAHILGLWMLATVLLAMYLTTVFFHVVSRFRAPIYGPLILLGAFAITEVVRGLSCRDIRSSALSVGVVSACIALVMILPWVGDNSIPLPTSSSPPLETVPVGVVFGEILELSGHAPLPVVEPGEPLFVTLYWKPYSSLSVDYYGTVQLIAPSGEKLTQMDQHLGTGSFPHYPSRRWHPGDTVTDRYLLFPPRDAPTPLALTVLVAVYNRETGERLGETTLKPLSMTFAEPLALPEEVTPVHASIGPTLLAAYKAKSDTNELTLTLYWESMDPTSVDGVVFVHLFNSTGDFILGQDLPPCAGSYPMTSWQPGEGIVDVRRIPLGELPASEYTVLIGVYDPVTGERFPIVTETGEALPGSSLKLFQTHLN